MSKNDFQERVRERILSEFHQVEIVEELSFGFKIKVEGNEVDFYLDNTYTSYLNNTEAIDEIIGNAVKGISTACSTSITPPDLGATKDMLYPMLKPSGYLDSMPPTAAAEHQLIVSIPFIADLIITFVIDQPRTLLYVNSDHLAKWQRPKEEIEHIAVQNLAAKSTSAFQMFGEGRDAMVISNTRDGFDATRLLLPNLHEKMSEVLNDDLIVGIPNRDFLVIVGKSNEDLIASVSEQVKKDSRRMEYSLTDKLFSVTAEKIGVYGED